MASIIYVLLCLLLSSRVIGMSTKCISGSSSKSGSNGMSLGLGLGLGLPAAIALVALITWLYLRRKSTPSIGGANTGNIGAGTVHDNPIHQPAGNDQTNPLYQL